MWEEGTLSHQFHNSSFNPQKGHIHSITQIGEARNKHTLASMQHISLQNSVNHYTKTEHKFQVDYTQICTFLAHKILTTLLNTLPISSSLEMHKCIIFYL